MSTILRFTLICNIDGILSMIAFYEAYWLRLESFPQEPIINTIVVFFSAIFSFVILGVYKRIWRYSSTNDLIIITKATLMTVVLVSFSLFLMTRLEDMPRSTMIIYFILLTLLSGGIRISYRLIRDKTLTPIHNVNERIKVILIGADDEAEALIRISHKPDGPYYILGIYDNDKSKWGRKIRDVDIIGPIDNIFKSQSSLLLKSQKITKIIITNQKTSRTDINLLLKLI